MFDLVFRFFRLFLYILGVFFGFGIEGKNLKPEVGKKNERN